ncbi:MAG: hypothetical protein AMXMBFR47_18330 [Planctomycetota bacterium]
MDALTPKQVARAIGVSDASLKRWCDKGVIESIRTAGGHRRIPLTKVMNFIRESGHQIVRPEILGLPPTCGCGQTVIDRSVERSIDALIAGDEQQFQRLIFDLFIAKNAVRTIADRVLAPALHAIGERWAHGEIEVFRERRACEIVIRTLHRLEGFLTPPASDAPLAIGGTPAGDPYMLPTVIAELVLREVGFRAESLGGNLPGATLAAAVRELRPSLVWLSVSSFESTDSFLADYATLRAAAVDKATAIAVGGRALDAQLRMRMEFAFFGDSMSHLACYADSLRRAGGR